MIFSTDPVKVQQTLDILLYGFVILFAIAVVILGAWVLRHVLIAIWRGLVGWRRRGGILRVFFAWRARRLARALEALGDH